MYLVGDHTELFQRLHLKRRLMLAGDPLHEEIRPGLLLLPGTMRGASGGGQVIALARADLLRTFTVMVGYSTGGAIGTYGGADQSELGTSVYWQECVGTRGPRFIHGLAPFFKLDTNYLAGVFRTGAKALNQDAIRSSTTQMFVGTTRLTDGKAVLIDLRTTPDIIDAMRASLEIPAMGSGPVMIEGEEYVDGAGASPFPVIDFLERFNPTDLLIIANAPGPVDRPLLVGRFWKTLLHQERWKGIRDQFASSPSRFNEGVAEFLKKRPCRAALAWCDETLDLFEQCPKKLETAATRSIELMSAAIGHAVCPVSS